MRPNRPKVCERVKGTLYAQDIKRTLVPNEYKKVFIIIIIPTINLYVLLANIGSNCSCTQSYTSKTLIMLRPSRKNFTKPQLGRQLNVTRAKDRTSHSSSIVVKSNILASLDTIRKAFALVIFTIQVGDYASLHSRLSRSAPKILELRWRGPTDRLGLHPIGLGEGQTYDPPDTDQEEWAEVNKP